MKYETKVYYLASESIVGMVFLRHFFFISQKNKLVTSILLLIIPVTYKDFKQKIYFMPDVAIKFVSHKKSTSDKTKELINKIFIL